MTTQDDIDAQVRIADLIYFLSSFPANPGSNSRGGWRSYAGPVAATFLALTKRIEELEVTLRDGAHPIIMTDVTTSNLAERIEELEKRTAALDSTLIPLARSNAMTAALENRVEKMELIHSAGQGYAIVADLEPTKAVTRTFDRTAILQGLRRLFPEFLDGVNLTEVTSSFKDDGSVEISYLANMS